MTTFAPENDVRSQTIAKAKRSALIANVRIDTSDFASAVDVIVARTAVVGANAYVVTPNAHHIVLLQRDARFRSVYEDAFLVVPDGVPLLWASKLLNQGLCGRVNGTDLLETLCAKSEQLGLRVFFLGGRKGAAEAAASQLRSRHPALVICGTYCPAMGFENDDAENARIVAAINEARTDILFVGLGAPKQELWMHSHRESLNARVSLGIGVSFEFIAGLVPRAPRWMQVAGLEWFFRLCSEPRRLWRRYLIGNATFCFLVMRQLFLRVARNAAKRPKLSP